MLLAFRPIDVIITSNLSTHL